MFLQHCSNVFLLGRFYRAIGPSLLKVIPTNANGVLKVGKSKAGLEGGFILLQCYCMSLYHKSGGKKILITMLY